MKKVITFLIIGIMATLAGCTFEDPGYVGVVGNPGVKVVDSDGDIVTIDTATGAIATIEYEHHEIHSGDSFSCWYLQEVTDTGDKTIVAFLTPNTTRWLHIIYTASATVMAHGRILEAPLIVDNTGDNLTIFNRDRNSSTTSTVIDTSRNPDRAGEAMTFTEITMGNVTGGTEIIHIHLGTGEGKKTLGGSSRGTQEWILKPNTLYAFEIESTNDDDNIHIINLDWYEHTNR